MAKNILYYIPELSRNSGGVFQYAVSVLEGMRSSKNKIYVYNHTETEFLSSRFGDTANIFILNHRLGKLNRFANKFRRILNLIRQEVNWIPEFEIQSVAGSILKKYNIDLIHSPTQNYPLNDFPFIFTLHDVQELHMPEYFTPAERENRARNNRIGCEEAARVIVSYNHVKADLVHFFGVAPDKVDVVTIGKPDPDIDVRETPLEGEKFLLYPAATWPHKNHVTLIEAFLKARNLHPDLSEFKLICTGHKTDHFNIIEEFIRKNNAMGFVEFRGVVSDQELKQLYHTTTAVVVPTKYEAGSFPLMEAIVQQVPVICSNVTSLPETIDHEAFVFDPDSIPEMSEKIFSIACDLEYRKLNLINSKRLYSTLTGFNIAQAFDEIYGSENSGQK